MIDQENQRYGPFLATTTVLMEAVKAGAGREEAHEAIKQHAVQTVSDLREGAIICNDLVERLALTRALVERKDLSEMVKRASASTGQADNQVQRFCAAVREEAKSTPEAATYQPTEIL